MTYTCSMQVPGTQIKVECQQQFPPTTLDKLFAAVLMAGPAESELIWAAWPDASALGGGCWADNCSEPVRAVIRL